MSDSSAPDESIKVELSVSASRSSDTVLDLLGAQSTLSRTQLKHAMACGAVWLQRGRAVRRIRRSTHALQKDDQLTLYYSEKILNELAPAPILLSDESEYSVWIKPRGVHSQGTRYGDHCAMVRLVEKAFHENSAVANDRAVMLVHRLDRYANGLMLLAHNKRAAAALSALFRDRAITKRYTALVVGAVSDERKGLVIDSEIDGKPARTTIVNIERTQNCSVLEVQIDTGRKHQVRRHLAEIGHAIVGDRQYGAGDSHADLQLSASSLAFQCPLSQQAKCYTLPVSYLSEMRRVIENGP